jgi:hypothetical protein
LEWWQDKNHPRYYSEEASEERQIQGMCDAIEHLIAENAKAKAVARAVAESAGQTKH